MPIFQGSKWGHTLYLQDPDGNPLDLTGLGPFVVQFDKANGNAIATATTAVDADPATGIVTTFLTAAQTIDFAIGPVRAGMRDAANNPYFQGLLQVHKFSPTPV